MQFGEEFGDEYIKALSPFSGVVEFRVKKEQIYKAMMLLYYFTCDDDLDTALKIVYTKIDKNQLLLRKYINLLDSIYRFTLDGFIEPKDFNIFEEYKVVVKFMREKMKERLKCF